MPISRRLFLRGGAQGLAAASLLAAVPKLVTAADKDAKSVSARDISVQDVNGLAVFAGAGCNVVALAGPGGARLETALTERFGNHRHVGDVRGRGLFWAIELVADRASKRVFDPALKMNERVKREALARGVATYPMGGTIDGKQGDHVIVAPPYIATASDIDMIVNRLGAAVDAALAG